jgi:hypothetical protein
LPWGPKPLISVPASRFPLFLSCPRPSGCSSTSVKTAPKPLTLAGVAPLVPGIKN